jgi:hypothetical protein
MRRAPIIISRVRIQRTYLEVAVVKATAVQSVVNIRAANGVHGADVHVTEVDALTLVLRKH